MRFDNAGGVVAYAPYHSLQEVAVVRSLANCGITFEPNPVQLVQIENSLFASNNGNGICINNANGTVSTFGGAVRVYNSVFWGNGGADVKLRSTDDESDVVLRYNVIQDLDLDPPSSSSPVQSLNQDPLFLNAAAGDFRLGNSSPARNSGTTATPSGATTKDIDGLPRIVAGVIDRGPHENQSPGAQFQYTVSNTNSTGVGSLYQALLDAEDTAGFNTIVFNIPGGACPNIITEAAATPFPGITEDLVIDGRTQPGWVGGSDDVTFDAQLCVIVRGGSGLDPDSGFEVPTAAPSTTTVAITGIAFSGYSEAAVDLRGGSGHRIFGNQFAGTVGATTLADNGYNIRVTRLAAPVLSGVQIGGDDPDARNLLGNGAAGVLLNGDFVRDAQVINNFIGLAANGKDALPNTYGILNTGALDSTIRDNWIAGNASDGMFLNTQDTFVQGNTIGVRSVNAGSVLSPDFELPNGGWGIRLSDSSGAPSGNVIGSGIKFVFGLPIPTGNGNVVAFNGAGGIRAQAGTGHRISRNILYQNTGLEIDIAADGATLNDNDGAGGAGSLSNRGVNYPALASATGGDKTGVVTGSLGSTNGTYRIELFYNNGCTGTIVPVGDARVYAAAGTVTISNAPAGQNGTANFSIPIAAVGNTSVIPDGRGFVAIAIDANGNSSELSFCREYENNGILFADSFE